MPTRRISSCGSARGKLARQFLRALKSYAWAGRLDRPSAPSTRDPICSSGSTRANKSAAFWPMLATYGTGRPNHRHDSMHARTRRALRSLRLFISQTEEANAGNIATLASSCSTRPCAEKRPLGTAALRLALYQGALLLMLLAIE